VGSAWEALQKNMKEGQGGNQKGFVQTRQELDRINQAMGGVNAAMSSFGTVVRGHLEEAAKSLSKFPVLGTAAASGLSGISSALAGIGARAATTAAATQAGFAGMGTAAAGAAGAIAGVGAAFVPLAAVGGKALYDLSESWSKAYVQARNYRELLEQTGTQIRQFERVAQRTGLSESEAKKQNELITKQLQDLTRGQGSQLW